MYKHVQQVYINSSFEKQLNTAFLKGDNLKNILVKFNFTNEIYNLNK